MVFSLPQVGENVTKYMKRLVRLIVVKSTKYCSEVWINVAISEYMHIKYVPESMFWWVLAVAYLVFSRIRSILNVGS